MRVVTSKSRVTRHNVLAKVTRDGKRLSNDSSSDVEKLAGRPLAFRVMSLLSCLMSCLMSRLVFCISYCRVSSVVLCESLALGRFLTLALYQCRTRQGVRAPPVKAHPAC